MLTINHINPSRRLAAGIALTFAAEVLPIFEKQYPKDPRPRNALIAAMKWLNGEATVEECHAAAHAASAAAYAAAHAASAAYTAAYVASAAYTAAYTAAYAAANAASAAARALNKNIEVHIHQILLQLLPLILQFKIDNHEKFNQAEEVFEYLNEEDRTKFLFNLDILC